MSRVGARLRAAWPVLVVVALALPLAAVYHASEPGDAGTFYIAGQTLLSSRWEHAFSDAAVQVGPLQLALFGAVWHLGPWLSVGRGTILVLLLEPLAAGAVTAVSLYAAPDAPRRKALALAAGVVTLPTGIALEAYDSGHPANLLVPLLWITAAVLATRGRAVAAGALIAGGAGIEVWSLLGLPVLLLARTRRERARGLASMALVAAVLFLPFALGGNFHMLDHRWSVIAGTPISYVVGAGYRFGWWLRLLQGAFAMGAGAVAVRLLRGTPHAVWVAPLAIVLVRLALDPLLNLYYFVEISGPALVGAVVLGVMRSGTFARTAEQGAL